jgi:hypothetical protein
LKIEAPPSLNREPHLQRIAASSGGDGTHGRSPQRSNRARGGEPTSCARPGAIVRCDASWAGSGHRNVAEGIVRDRTRADVKAIVLGRVRARPSRRDDGWDR